MGKNKMDSFAKSLKFDIEFFDTRINWYKDNTESLEFMIDNINIQKTYAMEIFLRYYL
jgi:hypothetical protein